MPIDKTKDKILKVSRELFMKKGYDATSMSEIAEFVGIKKASLYYFFKDKEHLYFEIMQRALDNILEYLKKAEFAKKVVFSKIIRDLIDISSEDSIISYILDTDSIDRKSKKMIEIHRGIVEIQNMFRKICKKVGVKDSHTASEVTLNAIHAYIVKSSCHKVVNVSPEQYSKYLAKLLENN